MRGLRRFPIIIVRYFLLDKVLLFEFDRSPPKFEGSFDWVGIERDVFAIDPGHPRSNGEGKIVPSLIFFL
jgi:hypothetical protein